MIANEIVAVEPVENQHIPARSASEGLGLESHKCVRERKPLPALRAGFDVCHGDAIRQRLLCLSNIASVRNGKPHMLIYGVTSTRFVRCVVSRCRRHNSGTGFVSLTRKRSAVRGCGPIVFSVDFTACENHSLRCSVAIRE